MLSTCYACILPSIGCLLTNFGVPVCSIVSTCPQSGCSIRLTSSLVYAAGWCRSQVTSLNELTHGCQSHCWKSTCPLQRWQRCRQMWSLLCPASNSAQYCVSGIRCTKAVVETVEPSNGREPIDIRHCLHCDPPPIVHTVSADKWVRADNIENCQSTTPGLLQTFYHPRTNRCWCACACANTAVSRTPRNSICHGVPACLLNIRLLPFMSRHRPPRWCSSR